MNMDNTRMRLVVACVVFLSLAGLSPAKEMTTVELVKFAKYSVVRIEVTGTVTEETDAGKNEKPVGMLGTGFLISEKGYIVTNWHVATAMGANWKEKPTIRVVFTALGATADAHPAKVVGVDELSDLAVLRVDDSLSPLHEPLKWAKSIQVGEDVVAIGFARGQAGAPTVTRGIVSAVDRSLSDGSFAGLVQTDAAINLGNSGGPLLNRHGEVVGVNTYGFGTRFGWNKSPVMDKDGKEFKVKGEGGKEHTPFVEVPLPDVTQGIGYARASETARPFVNQLIGRGQLSRANLGLQVATAVLSGESDYDNTTGGAIITRVAKDSVAEASGLKVGDVITGISGLDARKSDFYDVDFYRYEHLTEADRDIQSKGDLNDALVLIPSGRKVDVHYLRPAAKPGKFEFDHFNCSVDVK
jgi:serine protease Do